MIKTDIQIHQPPPELRLNEKQYRMLCRDVLDELKLSAHSCAVIFVEDAFLSEMHQRYLSDPSETDVITFNLGEEAAEGEIYISKDRVEAQAKQYGTSAEEEIIRLIIHGLLHLKGYDDIDEQDRLAMKKEENRLTGKYVKRLGPFGRP